MEAIRSFSLSTFMFWFLFYFATTYSLVLFVLGLCFHVLLRKKWQRGWMAVPALLLLPLPLLPYAQVAWQTQQYRDELMPVYLEGSKIHIVGENAQPPAIFRVLEFSPHRAVVYGVESCITGEMSGDTGWTMTLRNKGRGWEFSDFDAVWTDCGSAEGNTFPPYPEARSF